MKRSLTLQCVVGLILGMLAGALAVRLQPSSHHAWLGIADSAIRLWTNALQLVVTPLVVSQLFVAIAAHRGSKGDAAKLGLLIPAVFFGLLLLTALCAFAATAGLLASPLFGDLSLPSAAGAPAAGPVAGAGPFAGWLDDVIPPNLFAALARPGAILAVMLFTLAFALAARRLTAELQRALETGFRGVRDAMFVIVDWLVRIAPILLFALAFRSAAGAGFMLGKLLLAFVVVDSAALLLCCAALYVVATVVGRVPLGRFARAAFPAQVTAAATRSSLATVPVLLRESETTLELPSKTSSLVLPLGGATLKLSRAVTFPVMLLFLARLLGLTLGMEQVAIFTISIILLSPSTPGVPSILSGTRALPAFIAIGIPPEYVFLLGSTTAILDSLLTVLNTTGYLTANVLVARFLSPWGEQQRELAP